MKKLLSIILLISLSVTFYSCGDDKEEEKPKEFVWNGDWNDPADPNFKPEGYNPIKGVWRRVNTTQGIKYTEDFKAYTLTFYSFDGYDEKSVGNYVVNDKAYKLVTSETTRRYKVEGDVLTIYFHLIDIDDKNRDQVYVRIEP